MMSLSRRKPVCVLLAAAVLLTALAGCGAPEAEPEATPEIIGDVSLSGKPLTAGESVDKVFSLAVDYEAGLNPLSTTSTVNMLVNGMVYENLFEVDGNFTVSSRIATKWTCTEDGMWVITIDTTIPMHDGSTLTAADVAYSITRAAQRTPYGARLGIIIGCAAYGNSDVLISTQYTDTQLPMRLTVPVVKYGSVVEDAPVGTGPYMYSRTDDAAAATPQPTATPEPTDAPAEGEEDGEPEEAPKVLPNCLVKFSGYPGAETLPVDTVYLQPYADPGTLISDYESGRVDLVLNDPTGMYSMGYGGNNEKRVYGTTHMHYLGFNGYSIFLCYAIYRTALQWIVDREGIAEEVMDGSALASALPINPLSPRFDAAMNGSLSFDPARCLAELSKLGCGDLDGDGLLEFSASGSMVDIAIDFIVCSDTASKVQAARRIAGDMQAIGLDVTLRELSWRDYQEALKEGEFDMYYAETALTPDWDISPLVCEEMELNYGKWAEAATEDAIFAYLAAPEAELEAATSAMLTQLAAAALIIPVCFEQREVISHMGVIRGMEPNQYNTFHNISAWTVRLD